MADIKTFSGRVWNVPIEGTYTALHNADVGAILGSASGLAKALFFLGAGALGLAVAASGTYGNLRSRNAAVRWGTLCRVQVWSGWNPGFFGGKRITREFQGSCLTKELVISVDGHRLAIPLEYVDSYFPHTERHEKGFLKKTTIVETHVSVFLFDKSKYNGILLMPQVHEFITPVGKQSVAVDSYHSINGCTIEDLELLRTNVDHFLSSESNRIENVLGTESFKRYFARS